MRTTLMWLGMAWFGLSLAVATPRQVEANDDALVDSASNVLKEFMALPAKSIPQSLLAEAKGVAIIPRVVKGGFVVGVHHGKGVLLSRNTEGHWQPPSFISFTGAGVGWQAGLQSTDLILVFRNQGAIDRASGGKLTIGVDAAAAAGPLGRQTSAGTDASLSAEIYSYSRSRGLFVGLSVDGSSLQVDRAATQLYYQPRDAAFPGAPATPVIPASAAKLIGLLQQYTTPPAGEQGVPTPANAGVPGTVIVDPQTGIKSTLVRNSDLVRSELAASNDRLQALLDPNWKTFLAVPRELTTQGPGPSSRALADAIGRFDKIASNPMYAALAQRDESQSTLRLLKEYQEVTTPKAPALSLPPPPR